MTLTSDGLTSIARRGPRAMSNISQAERDKMPAEDFAGPDQSFPIRNQGDVDAAAHLVGKADNPEQVKARIMAICKRKGLDPPEAWPGGGKSADYVIAFGSAVKSLGDGKVGGYLVQWGGPDTADAEGEWFTPETDFDTDFPTRASVRYNHGMDPTIGRRRLGYGSMKTDDLGVWVEYQLDLADRHQAAIYGLAKAGKLGWSSGAVAHMTDPPRERSGGAIKSWPGIIHDASLTPMPSDPRNLAVALKSWDPPSLEELSADCAGKSSSLAENTDRWLDDGMSVLAGYASVAAKAGRKLSTARRSRLAEMRQMIDDLLNETEPRDAATDSESAPTPGMGEGAAEAGTKERAFTLPLSTLDVSNLYAAAVRQDVPGLDLTGRL